MQLRTPKRYRRQSRYLRPAAGCRLRLILLIPVILALAWIAWVIGQNPRSVRDAVIGNAEGIGEAIQTSLAPRPAPTATPDVLAARAACQRTYQQGQIDAAFEQCRTLTDDSPNDVDLHYQITAMLVFNSDLGTDARRLENAIMFADKTINANPEVPQGWAIRALVLDWRGDLIGALVAGLHAQWLDPGYAPVYAFLGEIYHDLGSDDLAGDYLAQAAALDTAGTVTPYILRTRGKIYADQGYLADAVEQYTAAQQQAPTDSYIAVELANNYITLGQADQAIELLTPLLTNRPHDTAVLFTLARAHTNLGAYERAYEYYQRCLDVDPANVVCLGRLGSLQYNNGNYEAAIMNLDRAIQLGSGYAAYFWLLGDAYNARGNCTQAVMYFQQGYQIAVENEDTALQTDFVNSLSDCGVNVTAP